MHNTFVRWLTSEPVRAYLYTVVVVVVGALVSLGVFSGGIVPVILAIAAAVLGTGVTETIRSAVSPAAPPNESPPPSQ